MNHGTSLPPSLYGAHWFKKNFELSKHLTGRMLFLTSKQQGQPTEETDHQRNKERQCAKQKKVLRQGQTRLLQLTEHVNKDNRRQDISDTISRSTHVRSLIQ